MNNFKKISFSLKGFIQLLALLMYNLLCYLPEMVLLRQLQLQSLEEE